MRPRIHRYQDRDLGALVSLMQREGHVPAGPDGLRLDDLTDLARSTDSVALLADLDGELAGYALGSVAGTVGTIHGIVADTDDLLDRLLHDVEQAFAARGVRTCRAAIHKRGDLHTLLDGRGYIEHSDIVVLHRDIEQRSGELESLGGRHVPASLWDDLKGMVEVKDVIERRIILPLSEPELASRHGVASPQSVILFGPPGTGKTTFAKGIASRLGWPFVPVEVAQLSDGDDGPSYLKDVFDQLLAAPAAVAFFDEVEDIAADRRSNRRVGSGVTNEFLRQLPRMRDSPDHLLVCATNAVGVLDAAFLRPGRFDYILPVGPPDAEARHAIWTRYVADITDEDVDVDALVGASKQFTPADIEFAARKAAQFSFEEAHDSSSGDRARTGHFLRAIEQTPPTLTGDMLKAFEDDVARFSRS